MLQTDFKCIYNKNTSQLSIHSLHRPSVFSIIIHIRKFYWGSLIYFSLARPNRRSNTMSAFVQSLRMMQAKISVAILWYSLFVFLVRTLVSMVSQFCRQEAYVVSPNNSWVFYMLCYYCYTQIFTHAVFVIDYASKCLFFYGVSMYTK